MHKLKLIIIIKSFQNMSSNVSSTYPMCIMPVYTIHTQLNDYNFCIDAKSVNRMYTHQIRSARM